MTRASAAAMVIAAAGLAGCQDPYANHPTTPVRPPRAVAPARGDASAPGPAAPSLGGIRSRPSQAPRAIARSFAVRWINWDWRTAAAQQRALARLATGGLARTLEANARSARVDATLARDKPGSRGRVAAIDLKRTAARAAGVVVTHEQTYTGGHADLGGQRYRVYLIALRREGARWEVTRWAPQP